MRRWVLIVVLAVAMMPMTAIGGDSFKIIVHPGVDVTSLSKVKVKQIFLKKTTQWSDGQRIKPVDQKKSSAVRRAFTKAVHGRSVSAIKNYWQQRIFSGRGVPPLEKASDAQIVSYVLSHPGAIGYVSVDTPIGDAKVITIK